MIVDTSALIAILLNEPEAEVFTAAILADARPRMSAAAYLEASLLLGGRIDRRTLAELDQRIADLEIVIEPVSVEHARAARDAGERYGRAHHPASLNFGDCFAYALAKVSGEPLLFKGNDFSQTDIAVALLL